MTVSFAVANGQSLAKQFVLNGTRRAMPPSVFIYGHPLVKPDGRFASRTREIPQVTLF
jgi:hypothetical protein